jgi:hypothetical protein
MAACKGLRAVAVEQLQQPASEHAQMGAAFGGTQEQVLRAGCSVMQTILRTVRAGGALVSEERFDMGRDFDLRAAIEAARVGGDHLGAFEDAHGIQSG